MNENNEKELNIVCLYLINNQIIIGNSVDNDMAVQLEKPYILNINHEGKLEFIPYLNEFTGEDNFIFNSLSVMNVFKPYAKYISKYIEIYNMENQQQLL